MLCAHPERTGLACRLARALTRGRGQDHCRGCCVGWGLHLGLTLNPKMLHRKGFVKIALQTGASLVPTFTFGETDTVTVVDTGKVAWARGAQRAFKALGGFTLPFVYGSGLFGLPFGLLPHRVPIFCVVGQPITMPRYTGASMSRHESLVTAGGRCWQVLLQCV